MVKELNSKWLSQSSFQGSSLYLFSALRYWFSQIDVNQLQNTPGYNGQQFKIIRDTKTR